MNRNQTILVIDDDPHLLTATVRLLQGAGFLTLQGATGQSCLDMVQKHHPGIILLDVDLPDINGIEVCERIKADPELALLFVVLVSNSAISSEQQSEGLEKGADGYIARPVSNRELLARVQAFLRIQGVEAELRNAQMLLKETLNEKEHLIQQLQKALQQVKTLSGLIPICSSCKKIRDDKGYWNQLEIYISQHTSAAFTHGICPECMHKLFPGVRLNE